MDVAIRVAKPSPIDGASAPVWSQAGRAARSGWAGFNLSQERCLVSLSVTLLLVMVIGCLLLRPAFERTLGKQVCRLPVPAREGLQEDRQEFLDGHRGCVG